MFVKEEKKNVASHFRNITNVALLTFAGGNTGHYWRWWTWLTPESRVCTAPPSYALLRATQPHVLLEALKSLSSPSVAILLPEVLAI